MFKMKLDMSGVEKMFQRLRRNAEELNGTRQVRLPELLTPEFLRGHSRFQNLDDFFKRCNVTADAFAQMTDGEKDQLARSHTTFATWQELLNAAGAEYGKKQLFK